MLCTRVFRFVSAVVGLPLEPCPMLLMPIISRTTSGVSVFSQLAMLLFR